MRPTPHLDYPRIAGDISVGRERDLRRFGPNSAPEEGGAVSDGHRAGHGDVCGAARVNSTGGEDEQ